MSEPPLVVVALGGNALLRRGEPLEAEVQRRNVAAAAAAIAGLAGAWRVVVTHGNLQAAAYRPVAPYPLDILGAESEGMIGYVIEQELIERLGGREVATLLTQVAVDPADPAFAAPSKPIGPVYGEAEARRLGEERGWSIARDGAHFRRVVASPAPRRILEINTIGLLVAAGVVVICAGGGGVPVAITEGGAIHGVEAVIDKDRSAALLARELAAEALLILTDVPAVFAYWDTPRARAIRRASPQALRAFAFDAGSMGPKVEAACDFAATGRRAGIGALADAAAILDGAAGTTVEADAELEWYPQDPRVST
jgi:carbamate kinase